MSVPAIFAGLALVFAVSYTNFIVPQLLGGGNYATLAVQVYEQTVVVLDWTRERCSPPSCSSAPS